MNCIILTAQGADQVRGVSKVGSALEPVLLADGVTYVLPARVISDSGHATKAGALGSKPRRDVAENEFAGYTAPEPEPEPLVTLNLTADEVAEIDAAIKGAASAGLLEKLRQVRGVFKDEAVKADDDAVPLNG